MVNKSIGTNVTPEAESYEQEESETIEPSDNTVLQSREKSNNSKTWE